MIVIGWIDGGTTTGDFAASVARLASYEVAKSRLHTILRVQSGPQMPEGRNLLVEQFLDTDGDWLMMIDTDMIFDHTIVEQLLETADEHMAPVVGGLCFGINKEFGQFPTMYQNVDGLPVVMLDVPDQRIVSVDATGAAFVLTHRTVFENNRREGKHIWFHRQWVPPTTNHPGGILGEDISWHWWLRSRGVPIFVDTEVDIGHIKPTIVSKATYARMKTDG